MDVVKFPSEGRLSLIALLQQTDGGQTAVAKRLRELGAQVSQPSVGAWARGEARPETVFREVLFLAYGIDPDAWKTDEERQMLVRVAESIEAA